MKSTNFLVATVDKNFNLFRDNEGEPLFIERIAEHIKRLEEISDGHHFYIDELVFRALGSSNFPLRFTRVFSNNPDELKRSQDYRIHHTSELADIVNSKDRFSPNVQIFFLGGSEFLELASRWSKKLLLTVVDRDWTNNSIIIDKFPLEAMQNIFQRRREIEPELLDKIKAYKALKAKQTGMKLTETIIADNGMKIIQPVIAPAFDVADDILNTPDYKFFEYRK